MASASTNKICLKSSDGEIFEVEKSVATMSITIKNMIEDVEAVTVPLPIPHIKGGTLAKVVEYCQKHVDDSNEIDRSDELKQWDKDYMKVNMKNLNQLSGAANYLDIKGLRDLTSQALTDLCKDFTAYKVMKFYNENHFTPEEEAEFRNKYASSFEYLNDLGYHI